MLDRVAKGLALLLLLTGACRGAIAAPVSWPETGACCICDGTCIDGMTEAECEAFARTVSGRAPQEFAPGAPCFALDCAPAGACCLCDGFCIDGISEPDCDQLALTRTNRPPLRWVACTPCAEIDCLAVGACCLVDDSCLNAWTLDDCAFFAEATTGMPPALWQPCATCIEAGCAPLGACCLPDGSCLVIDALGCDDLGGAAQGAGTSCATVNCAPGDPADLDGDGIVGFLDLTILLASWGPCDACPADLDGDGLVGFPDLVILIASLDPPT